MGKLSLNKKKINDDDNKQKKISSFFNSGATAKKSSTSSDNISPLFQSVGSSKTDQSLSKPLFNQQPVKVPLEFSNKSLLGSHCTEASSSKNKSQEDPNPTLIIKPYNVKGKQNHTNPKSNSASSKQEGLLHETNYGSLTKVSVTTGENDNQRKFDKEQTPIPETQLDDCEDTSKTPIRKPAVSGNDSMPVDSPAGINTSSIESDTDIIPATPGASCKTGQLDSGSGRKRIYNSRSFLSSTLSNKPPGLLTSSNEPQAKNTSKHGKNQMQQKPPVRRAVIGEDCGWDRNDRTMAQILSVAGIPDAAKQEFGLVGPDMKPRTSTHESKEVKHVISKRSDLEYADKKTHSDGYSLRTDRKRQRSNETSEIVNPNKSPPLKKRQMNDKNRSIETKQCPNKSKPLGLGTRGGLLLEKSKGYTKPKHSDSEESQDENDLVTPDETGLKLFSKESTIEDKTDYKKFSWKSKNKLQDDTKVVQSKSENKKSATEKQPSKSISDKHIVVKSECIDSNLNDILGELNTQNTDTSASNKAQELNVPTVKLVKKRTSIGEKKLNFNMVKKNSTEQSVNKDICAIDHTESDDALSDIMSELKQTLTQQNELSKKKSSSKKRKYAHRPPQNLDTSISRQLDFNKSFENIDHDLRSPPPKGEIKENNSSELALHKNEIGDLDKRDVDEHVTGSKACGSLFQEDSWMEDVDMEIVDACISPSKQVLNNSSCSVKYDPRSARPPAEAFGRHKITEVNHSMDEIVLTVEPMDKGPTRGVILHGFWMDTNVEVGDVIHVVGEFNTDNVCHVTDTENFVIVNPDLLISGTTVVSTVYCMRKSVLNEKFKGTDGRNIHMLHGTIIHAFFQEILLRHHNRQPIRAMDQVAKEILNNNSYLHEMYAVNATQESVMEEMVKLFPQVTKFIQSYMNINQSTSNQRTFKDMEIVDIKDIEENVWSPRFGVKGKIDLTVEVKINNDRKSQHHKGTANTRLMPLELKTGKPTYSVEHKGQVTLYSMMSSDRREDPQGGLLLYLRDPNMKTIPATYSHKRGLIQLRNELAHYLKSSSQRNEKGEFGSLPPPINSERSCGKCPHLLNCTAYQSAIEKKQAIPNHAMHTLVPQALGHLTQEHLEYFRHWCELMHLETNASRSIGVSRLWCETAWKREEDGEAFCGMILLPSQCKVTEGEYMKHLQAFQRHPNCTVTGHLSTVGVMRGDSVVVSAENQPLISLCMGSVHSVSDTVLILLVDRDLRKNPEYTDLVYRIDKCDTYNSMATNFTNTSRLLENSQECEKLRELIIEKRPPQFELTLSKSIIEKVMPIFKKLNKPQKTAILKVLMCKDYVLIKGFPGTGKTSTIVALVRILFEIGFSVLLTSYTHSAVDNILLKLKQYDVSFLRMGRTERIHPDIQPYSAETLTKQFTTVEQLTDFYSAQRVVATTCLGTSHVLFTQRRFDLCIVDEASQVLQPACFGPLFCSNKFVLVGDPLQLPPVVQSNEAKHKGMAQSLFARLDETGGTYELNMQYRMNSEIMRLSNTLVYNGALKCGSGSVASGTLHYTRSVPQDYHEWIKRSLSSDEKDQVLFLNTEKVLYDGNRDSAVENRLEASILEDIVQKFIEMGVPHDEVGVIAPYRQQVRLLQDRFSRVLSKVEVNTVDQYQGRDKQVIVLSFVKQQLHVTPRPGEILQDLRRLNVALTRAKYKLLLIGHKTCLKQFTPISNILNILRQDQIIELPGNTYTFVSR